MGCRIYDFNPRSILKACVNKGSSVEGGKRVHILREYRFFTICFTGRNDDGTFTIPAKLPKGTEEITWMDNPKMKTYIGRRVECRDESDMFSPDTFPCLQVSSINRYRERNVKPKLSCFAVKVKGKVEGLIQLTQDKRAFHIAIRSQDDQVDQGIAQLNEMEEMVFEQIAERSRGTDVTVCYLSPLDMQKSTNLEDNVRFYRPEDVDCAEKHGKPLTNPTTFADETVESVTGMKHQDPGKYF